MDHILNRYGRINHRQFGFHRTTEWNRYFSFSKCLGIHIFPIKYLKSVRSGRVLFFFFFFSKPPWKLKGFIGNVQMEKDLFPPYSCFSSNQCSSGDLIWMLTWNISLDGHNYVSIHLGCWLHYLIKIASNILTESKYKKGKEVKNNKTRYILCADHS